MQSEEATIPEAYVGLLYRDGAFERLLEPGRHRLASRPAWLRALSFDRTEYMVRLVDLRERSLTIKGQEILTADKVAIRVSLLVYFRVKEPQSAVHNVSSYEERIYEDVQLAARRFLASRTLDAILSDRNEISDAVRVAVSGGAETYGVEILRADVKDLVFPGNLREIMNQVLETERRAEAKLIEARKEVETQQIRTEAENRRIMQQMDAERAQATSEVAIRQERERARLESELELAHAMSENPMLLRLRQLDTLETMARQGARFVVGLESGELSSALRPESPTPGASTSTD